MYFNRRAFAGGIGLLAAAAPGTQAQGMGAEITRNNAAIHQEVSFAANIGRVYQTLTATDQFDRVVRLSAAMETVGPSLKANPTRIDARPGGAFTLFGGYIHGFNLELVPNKLLLQAWRSESWASGLMSIARFALSGNGAQTVLTFDHAGFPSSETDHLALGWRINYWEPMHRFLSGSN